jgi:hypothetical protein
VKKVLIGKNQQIQIKAIIKRMKKRKIITKISKSKKPLMYQSPWEASIYLKMIIYQMKKAVLN